MSSIEDAEELKRVLQENDMGGLVEWVEKHGIDAVVRISGSFPVLTHCAKFDFTAGVVWLLEQGADVRKEGAFKRTALHRAQSAAVVEALSAAGAELEAADNGGQTPLFTASFNGHDEAVAALIAAGADLNAVNKQGWTALITASYNGHKRVVELLMAAAADTAHKDNSGRTAEEWAVEQGHPELAAIIRAGADKATAGEEEKKEEEEAAAVAAAATEEETAAAAAAESTSSTTAVKPAEVVGLAEGAE
eukprot:PLAT3561.1.p1 GENE.PLAT3561.1~~PLAT3561.1.p1  ORF type:complete len:249 (+),score=76.34 PLAT3561.1:105-851(+)